MDIVEFAERILGLELRDFQKQYLTRLYDIYEKDPESFNKFTYPCCRGYARFNRLPFDLCPDCYESFSKWLKEYKIDKKVSKNES